LPWSRVKFVAVKKGVRSGGTSNAHSPKDCLRHSRQDAINLHHTMKAATNCFAFQNRGVRRAWTLVALVLFVTLQVFAASGPLHKAIHADATAPNHHCVITLLTHGQVNAPAALPGLVAFAAALIFCLPPFNPAVFSSFDYRLSPSRAPPRF
jgi:hypothetical protein